MNNEDEIANGVVKGIGQVANEIGGFFGGITIGFVIFAVIVVGIKSCSDAREDKAYLSSFIQKEIDRPDSNRLKIGSNIGAVVPGENGIVVGFMAYGFYGADGYFDPKAEGRYQYLIKRNNGSREWYYLEDFASYRNKK